MRRKVRRHINKTTHTGVLVDEPKVITLKNYKKILSFTLRVDEHFTLADGSPGLHENFFTYEVLGKNVDAYLNDLIVGNEYLVEGYMRADSINGEERVRVRCFNILPADVELGDERE